MKSPISSSVWETKKAQIARLYMEEEWPLKQVIKQIRSDDFNPSETQLRSRLKKWRVTKPSRQSRKKPQASIRSGNDPHAERECQSSAVPQKKLRPPQPSSTGEAPTTSSECRVARPRCAPLELSQPPISNQQHPPRSKFSPPLVQQLSPISPPGDHVLALNGPPGIQTFSSPRSNATPYNQISQQTSPAGASLIINTTSAVTPSYPNTSYPLSPESCLPSPEITPTPAGIVWPARSMSADLGLPPALTPGQQWHSMPFEPIPRPPGISHPGIPMSLAMSAGPLTVPPHGHLSSFPQYAGDAPWEPAIYPYTGYELVQTPSGVDY